MRPVAHRTMGAIQVSPDGATAVAGLYAMGGCDATSVHGANDLAGNWLLEALVFGGRAGVAAAEQKRRSEKGIEAQLEDERRRITAIMDRPVGPEKAVAIRSELGRLMRAGVRGRSLGRNPWRDCDTCQ